jgi:regulatory protein
MEAASTDPLFGPDDRLQHALDLAYRHLARRDRTEAEVRRHLAARGIEPPLAELAIAQLTAQDYLDDTRYAHRFAEDRRTLDQWGNERIEQRLLAVGVDPVTIAAVLADQTPDAELNAAIEVLRRRVPSPPANAREADRALGLLLRRGYELDLAHDAIRAYRGGATG